MEGPTNGPGLAHQLSMRCTQFLSSMSQLEDTWQASGWFDDLLKSHAIGETISFEGLRNLLTTFIKEIKDKHDVQKRYTADWIMSEITYIHQMLKGEQHNTSIQTQSVPTHLEIVLKDVKPMISSIHAKLDAGAKETKPYNKNVSSGQSSTPNAKPQTTPGPLQAQIKALEKEKRQLTKDLDQKEKNFEKREEELKKLQETNIELTQENTILQNFNRQIDDLKTKLRKADLDLEVSQKNNAALEKKFGEAAQNVEQLTQANKDLQQRYSTLAGAKMSHENPDIADLSDPYRPTKIGEMFSELYDNQWTDGFAALTKHGDEKAIQILMSLLKETNKFCKQESQILRQILRSNIQEICTLQGVYSKQKALKGGQTNLVKDRRIDDLIRDNAMLPVKGLQQKFLKESESNRKKLKTEKDGGKAVTDYVEKCVELCWLMAIQSPPVAIDENVEVYENKPFDERRFKPYTKKGKLVDYVVWPVLSIPDGGLLGKGVVQCK